MENYNQNSSTIFRVFIGAITGFIVGTLLFALMLIVVSEGKQHFLNPQDTKGKILFSLIVSIPIGGITGAIAGAVVSATKANILLGFAYGAIVGAVAFLYFYFNLNPIPQDAGFLEVLETILFFPVLPTSITGLVVSFLIKRLLW